MLRNTNKRNRKSTPFSSGQCSKFGIAFNVEFTEKARRTLYVWMRSRGQRTSQYERERCDDFERHAKHYGSG